VKTIDVSQASDFLRDYAHEAQEEVVILTDRGAPLAAVVLLRGMDRETFAVSSSPTFQAIMQRARDRRRKEGGISHEQILQEFGLGHEEQADTDPATNA
jgi:hypothetical protein